jgi:hypothetical protein
MMKEIVYLHHFGLKLARMLTTNDPLDSQPTLVECAYNCEN